MARRYLHYTREEWLSLPWDMQRCHLEGLAADGLISLNTDDADEPRDAPWEQEDAPPIAVESRPGGQVIDLQQMIRELRPESAAG